MDPSGNSIAPRRFRLPVSSRQERADSKAHVALFGLGPVSIGEPSDDYFTEVKTDADVADLAWGEIRHPKFDLEEKLGADALGADALNAVEAYASHHESRLRQRAETDASLRPLARRAATACRRIQRLVRGSRLSRRLSGTAARPMSMSMRPRSGRKVASSAASAASGKAVPPAPTTRMVVTAACLDDEGLGNLARLFTVLSRSDAASRARTR